MHNGITILDRAIKARARRDRDGKKRRPVVDSLIEYAEDANRRAVSAEVIVDSLRLDADVLRDVIAKQSAAMESMESEIAILRAQLEQVRDAAMVSEQTES